MYLAQAMNRFRVPLIAVAALVLALAAVWALAPGSNVRGQTDLGGCELTPWLRDALLDGDNYDLPSYECDDLELDGIAIWDFSGRNLPSFAISDRDYELLLELSGLNEDSRPDELDGFGDNEEVRLIDLTGNPRLNTSNVNFRNIPVGTGIALSIRGTTGVVGFQDDEYTVTENGGGYISVAFPGVLESDQESLIVQADVDADSDQEGLISIGRDMLLHGDSRSVIYYWPIYVESDNDIDDFWTFDLEIDSDADAYRAPDGSGRRESLDLEDVLNGGRVTEIGVNDADAPTVEVCQRSGLVEEAIEDALDELRQTVGHRGCNITLNDLSLIEDLNLFDADDGRSFELESGDLEGLSGLRSLRLEGVSRLPRGIFAGVGDKEEGVVIDFARNDPEDPDDAKAGDYDPGDIPSHVLSDLEPQQALLLTGETDSKGDPLVTGLDQESYSAGLGESFAVTLPLYFDGDSTEPVTHYAVVQLPYDFSGDFLPVVNTDEISDEIIDLHELDVVRKMIAVPEEEEEEKGQWVLFVFGDDAGDFESLVDWALINSS